MKILEAKEIARQWVVKRAGELPDVIGAFFVGSIVTMHDEEELPSTSDLDIRIIVGQDVPYLFSNLNGEFIQTYHLDQGIILDTIYWSTDEFSKTSADILGEPLAASFLKSNAILDPSGDLERLHRKVRAYYRDAAWVSQRCETAREMLLPRFALVASGGMGVSGYASDLIEIMSWLYLGIVPVAAAVPCIANLQGITLRTCLVKARNTLIRYDQAHTYNNILYILGLDKVNETEVRSYLTELSTALDYARAVYKTPFYGDHHLQAIIKPLVIDGSWELVNDGLHREAMLWVIGMRNWVQNAIENDGTEPEKTRFRLTYKHLLSTIGIRDSPGVVAKANALRLLLPEIMTTAHEIIDKHPDIYRQR